MPTYLSSPVAGVDFKFCVLISYFYILFLKTFFKVSHLLWNWYTYSWCLKLLHYVARVTKAFNYSIFKNLS